MTRFVVDKSILGSPGNEMAFKQKHRRRGAEPPKNESGRTGPYTTDLPDRYRAASFGNGTSIAVHSF